MNKIYVKPWIYFKSILDLEGRHKRKHVVKFRDSINVGKLN